jgi:hypothetical protein
LKKPKRYAHLLHSSMTQTGDAFSQTFLGNR